MPDFSFEDAALKRGFGVIAGVDEAGRGPWAGPVVAGAVILNPATLFELLRNGLDDSKKLSAAKREALFEILLVEAVIGVGVADVGEIDDLNILQATLLAMRRAVGSLSHQPDYVLVDGTQTPDFGIPAEAVKQGDGRSLSVAAASIVAKVTRDRIMADLAGECPGYGWDHNAGYGTAEHRAALDTLGVTPHHRRTFKPIRALINRA